MKSEALIQALVADLKPVRRLPSAALRTLCWASLAASSVAVLACALGLRADLLHALREASFVRESAALLVAFALAASSAFQLSVPGNAAQQRMRLLPLFAVVAWFSLIAARYALDAPGAGASAGLSCVARILGMSSLPGITAHWMLRRAAPFERQWVFLMASLASLSLSVLGTQLVCAKDDAAHALLWHFSPLLIAAFVALNLSKL